MQNGYQGYYEQRGNDLRDKNEVVGTVKNRRPKEPLDGMGKRGAEELPLPQEVS